MSSYFDRKKHGSRRKYKTEAAKNKTQKIIP